MQTKTDDDLIPDPFVNVKPEEVEPEQDDRNYSCPQCGKYLSSARSLKRHLKSYHENDVDKKVKHEPQVEEKCIITCKECKVMFTTPDEYQKHKLTHKQSFECDVCHRVFLTRFRLKVYSIRFASVNGCNLNCTFTGSLCNAHDSKAFLMRGLL